MLALLLNHPNFSSGKVARALHDEEDERRRRPTLSLPAARGVSQRSFPNDSSAHILTSPISSQDITAQRVLRGPSRIDELLATLLVQFLMQLEVYVLGQKQTYHDCGAAVRHQTMNGSLLLNRPSNKGSSFHLSFVFFNGSLRKGIAVHGMSIFFYYSKNENHMVGTKIDVWCTCDTFSASRNCSHVYNTLSS